MKHIPVVAISDNKLSFAVGALFVNLLETKDKTTFYELVAVLSPDVTKENIDKIKQVQKLYPNDCSVKIIQMDSRFDAIPNKTGYIANACAYKMCLGEILPEYKKVVYLDTDIIVFGDLSELYDTDMDDAYIAGVHSLFHYLYRRHFPERLQIADMACYINAGIMVMNLDKIRNDKIQTKLTKLIGTYNDSVDQHIFNRVCYGHIKLVSPVYNTNRTHEWLYEHPEIFIGLTPQQVIEVKEHPMIYHYTGPQKPWRYFDLRYSAVWLRYYKKSPFGDKNLDLISQKEEAERLAKERALLEMQNNKSVPARRKRKWYKKLLSVDKINIKNKRRLTLRILGFEIHGSSI